MIRSASCRPNAERRLFTSHPAHPVGARPEESLMYAKTFLTTVAALASIGFAGASLAAPAAANPDQMSVAVGVGDLNLATQPGAAVALRRIHNAAQSICGPAP